jgi:hypothetical protein
MEELIKKLLGSCSASGAADSSSVTGFQRKETAQKGPHGHSKTRSGRTGGTVSQTKSELTGQPVSGSRSSVASAVKWLFGASSTVGAKGGSAAAEGGSPGDPAPVWVKMAEHLQRIAGNQVRVCLQQMGGIFAPVDPGLASSALVMQDAALELSKGLAEPNGLL